MAVSSLDALQETARRSKKFVGGLVSDCARTAAKAIIENQPDHATVTILATEWKTDNTDGYPAYYDIGFKGIETKHRADVIFPLASLPKAEACGVCSVTETLTGKIRLRAATAPTENLTAQIWATYGKETENAGNDE